MQCSLAHSTCCNTNEYCCCSAAFRATGICTPQQSSLIDTLFFNLSVVDRQGSLLNQHSHLYHHSKKKPHPHSIYASMTIWIRFATVAMVMVMMEMDDHHQHFRLFGLGAYKSVFLRSFYTLDRQDQYSNKHPRVDLTFHSCRYTSYTLPAIAIVLVKSLIAPFSLSGTSLSLSVYLSWNIMHDTTIR